MKSRSSIILIVVAAVLVELTSASMYWFASRGIRQEVQHRAEAELHVKDLEIQKVVNSVETAVNNSVWTIEHSLGEPDSLMAILHRLTARNTTIVGAGLLFTPHYYPQKGRWFEPYVLELPDGTFKESQIGGPDHDYFQKSWWKEAMSAHQGYWSEPYFDDSGAKMMLCSFFMPIRDVKGATVALLGADVSLDWLSDVINANHVYPSSYNVMISRSGQLMACPIESLVLRKNIQEMTARIEDTTARFVNKEMMAGRSGKADVKNEKGEKYYIFYAPVGVTTEDSHLVSSTFEGSTPGWSMAVVCSDKEIYYGLRQLAFNLMLLMIVGLALMGYIIWRAVRNAHQLQLTQSENVAMEKELHIASAIQKALLPKSFPPFPDRQDVDISAMQTPAREVGGDLYDFYIRDEKLIFCIGDVAGKGIPAALVMAITRTLFRNVSAHESQPHRILSAINNTLSEDNPDDIFVTFFVGVLDLPTGRLRYANAGHESPLLFTNDGTTTVCQPLAVDSNLPLGTMPGWTFTQQEVCLHGEATVFLYTDGVTEAMDYDKALFGKERMYKALRCCEQTSSVDPKTVIDVMRDAVAEFVSGAEQNDDMTMLSVRYARQEKNVSMCRSITLPNDVQTVPQLNDFVRDVCQTVGLDEGRTLQLNLAVEEAVVNVMDYAYPEGTKGDVVVEAVADDCLKFIITDTGAAFDPTAQPDADTTLSVEERPIGGLGIFLMRQYMDSINYERVDDKNVLTLSYSLEKVITEKPGI